MQLKTLIPFLKKNNDGIKIHFARGPYEPDEALMEFMMDKDGFRKWQELQNRKNFNCNYVLSLIRIDKGEWLFGGIYLVKGYKQRSNGDYKYSTELHNPAKRYFLTFPLISSMRFKESLQAL